MSEREREFICHRENQKQKKEYEERSYSLEKSLTRLFPQKNMNRITHRLFERGEDQRTCEREFYKRQFDCGISTTCKCEKGSELLV